MDLLENVVFWAVAVGSAVALVVVAYFAGAVVLP